MQSSQLLHRSRLPKRRKKFCCDLFQDAPAGERDGAGVAFGEPLFVPGALDDEFMIVGDTARREKQRERADAVEIAVVALDAEPVEKFLRVALRGAGPELVFPSGDRLEQIGRDKKGMLEARTEMAAVDADDDTQFLPRRKFFEDAGQRAAEPVEIGEIVPAGHAFDIIGHAAAQERDEADGFFFREFPRMKLMERLEPNQREFDGMFAVMRPMKKVARGIGFGNEGVDDLGRADGAAQRRDVIAPVEIPFEMRAMADAENDVGVGKRRFQERAKGGGVGADADTKINVGSDDARERNFWRSGRQLVRRAGGEGLAEKREGLCGLGGIAGGVMLGGESRHGKWRGCLKN